MQFESLDDSSTAFLVVLDAGEELISVLEQFADQHAGGREVSFTGLGAASSVHLLAFDVEAQQYKTSARIDEQVEIASVVGNIGQYEGKPIVHAHLVVGRRDGTTAGGHAKEAHIRPTCELTVRIHDHSAVKRVNAEWNAPLYDLD